MKVQEMEREFTNCSGFITKFEKNVVVKKLYTCVTFSCYKLLFEMVENKVVLQIDDDDYDVFRTP